MNDWKKHVKDPTPLEQPIDPIPEPYEQPIEPCDPLPEPYVPPVEIT